MRFGRKKRERINADIAQRRKNTDFNTEFAEGRELGTPIGRFIPHKPREEE
jgi:hypothetical protein